MDPQNLTANASLNRVRIVDLPGVRLSEEDIKGKFAFDLLSARALGECIREEADHLLLADAGPSHLPLLLDSCFESSSRAVREAAESIARRYGHRLGYLIATLKRGDEINRIARPQWDDSHWQQWAGIREIRLGGGLVSGHLGRRVAKYAQEALEDADMYDCSVSLSDFPSLLPLIGAARSAPAESRAMLVFDFGGTFTKRAHAFYKDGTLASLKLLPSQEVWRAERVTEEDGGEHMYNKALSLAEQMVATMFKTWQQAIASDLNIAPRIVAAIASYIVNGQPESSQSGLYSELRRLSSNIETWFSEALSERIGQPVTITFLHDGTAAARTFAGQAASHTAVILLGTALGVGFPPAGVGLRPIAQPLAMS